MVKRWIGAGILDAQQGFRRLRGHKSMPVLVAVLAEQTDRIDEEDVAAA